MISQFRFPLVLGLLIAVFGSTEHCYAGSRSPIRWLARNAGNGVNRGFLVLEEHQYFMTPSKTGFTPLFGGMGEGAGLTGGLAFKKPVFHGFHAMIGARASLRSYQRYEVGISKESDRFVTGPSFALDILPEQDFFGEGQYTDIDDRSTFAVQATKLNWFTSYKQKRVQWSHILRWQRFDISDGRDPRFPTTQSTFLPAEVSGGFADTQWISNQVEAFIDFRDQPENTRSGTGFDVSASFQHGIANTDTDFTTLRLVNYAYLPLPTERFHIFALRTEVIRNLSDDPIPFYMQPTIGGSGTLRGFREYRFRDRDAFALTAEYRYRVWTHIDAVLFADFGQVYSNIVKDFGTNGLESSKGFGLRLHTPNGFNLRMSVGTGRENTRLFVSLGPSW